MISHNNPQFLRISFLLISFFLLCNSKIFSQNVLIHSSFEDGDSLRDGDQTKNGVILWKTGFVHVVRQNPYFIPDDNILKIEPGAIVKVAGEFQVDNNGTLISWREGGYMQAGKNAAIQMEGATITDIRDDTGGDTNQDGGASTPDIPDFGKGFVIILSGSEKSFFKNSTLKYLGSIRNIGSTTFTDNNFLLIYSFENANDGNIGEPVLSGNLFEFSNNLSQLRLNGLSPVITDNTFRYSPQVKIVNGSFYSAILVGPYISSDKSRIVPQNGSAIISHNTFDTGIPICIGTSSERPVCSDFPDIPATFHVRIFKNKFHGNRGDGSTLPGPYGIRVDLSSDAAIFGNEFKNFFQPIQLMSCTSTKSSSLQVNYNQFEKIEGQNIYINGVSDNVYQNGVRLNFENNYWGHPSGPSDPQAGVDGISNSRGQGIYALANGIDYIPFIGGSFDFGSDELHINVEQVDPLPNIQLVAGYDAVFKITADKFRLASADSGILVVNVRDATGVILNLPETVIKVNATNTSVTIPDIQIKIPDFNPYILFEARLEPRGRNVINSNLVQFKVELPYFNSLKVEKIEGLPESETLIPGNNYNVKVKLKYSLSTLSPTAKGSIEIEVKEKMHASGAIIKEFPLVKFDAAPGRDLTTEVSIMLGAVLKDIFDAKDYSDVHLNIFLKNDSGKVVGKFSKLLGIHSGLSDVRIQSFQILNDVNGTLINTGRDHFLTGEKLIFKISYKVKVRTENVNNWQIWVEPVLFAKNTGSEKYVIDSPANINVSTTSAELQDSFLFKTEYVIEPDVNAIIPHVRLYDPTRNITVQYDLAVKVVKNANQYVQKEIPAGNSEVKFEPIIITRKFINNPTPSRAFAEEFPSKFSVPLPPGKIVGKTSSPGTINADTYWKFISLNKHWSVYDDLPESSSGDITFGYNPATDFPSDPGFNEDSLVLAGLNPYSNELEVLPTVLNKTNHTLTTQFSKFYDIWVAASKTTLITDIENTNEVPTEYSVTQNYPNPFNPSTVIKYRVPAASLVKLDVYNILGECVAQLVNEVKNAGSYQVTFNAVNLPSGIYFYRLISENYTVTKKMIMLK